MNETMITTQKTQVVGGLGIYVNGALVADVYEAENGTVFVMAYKSVTGGKVVCKDYTA